MAVTPAEGGCGFSVPAAARPVKALPSPDSRFTPNSTWPGLDELPKIWSNNAISRAARRFSKPWAGPNGPRLAASVPETPIMPDS